MGDSTLDNKHWIFSDQFRTKEDQLRRPNDFTAKAVNGYEKVFAPPARMVKDVSYFLNQQAAEQVGNGQLCTIMSSVEESTISDRSDGLLKHDAFIRDHITSDDVLIISVGELTRNCATAHSSHEIAPQLTRNCTTAHSSQL